MATERNNFICCVQMNLEFFLSEICINASWLCAVYYLSIFNQHVSRGTACVIHVCWDFVLDRVEGNSQEV